MKNGNCKVAPKTDIMIQVLRVQVDSVIGESFCLLPTPPPRSPFFLLILEKGLKKKDPSTTQRWGAAPLRTGSAQTPRRLGAPKPGL